VRIQVKALDSCNPLLQLDEASLTLLRQSHAEGLRSNITRPASRPGMKRAVSVPDRDSFPNLGGRAIGV
jgi:hypothetical protein